MADIASVVQMIVSAGGGAALLGLGRYLGKRLDRGDVAKDEFIASLRTELAHERAERARERQEAKATQNALGSRLDATAAQLERERLQAAGVAVRMRMDSQVDESEFEPDMPTAVRDRADLISPKKSIKPPSPEPPPKPPRIVEVDARKPGARPTDPAPAGYPRRGRS